MEGKSLEEKMHNQLREPQPYEDCQAKKSIQEFGCTSQGMDCSWGSGHQEPPHTDVSRNLATVCRQRRLTWLRNKKNWTVAQWTKVPLSDESKFCISFVNQGP